MKQRKFLTKALAGILCVLMLTSVIPVASFAAYNKDFVSETHDVFKSTSSTLAPGVDQYINYAYAKDGKQMVRGILFVSQLCLPKIVGMS